MFCFVLCVIKTIYDSVIQKEMKGLEIMQTFLVRVFEQSLVIRVKHYPSEIEASIKGHENKQIQFLK